ncbi:MAG TPA: response regulator, partial [Spirochaetota bacterium]|nr:response regulator [Spirochaetota bacterium]
MSMSQKIKVMVVDDSALVRKVITDILESDKDIEVIGTANNGKSAVFKNLTLNPDVITMDIEMPIMDGLEALQEIIKTNPKPVIMMSVLTQYGAEATFRALEFGAIDFIPKPSNLLAMS